MFVPVFITATNKNSQNENAIRTSIPAMGSANAAEPIHHTEDAPTAKAELPVSHTVVPKYRAFAANCLALPLSKPAIGTLPLTLEWKLHTDGAAPDSTRAARFAKGSRCHTMRRE